LLKTPVFNGRKQTNLTFDRKKTRKIRKNYYKNTIISCLLLFYGQDRPTLAFLKNPAQPEKSALK